MDGHNLDRGGAVVEAKGGRHVHRAAPIGAEKLRFAYAPLGRIMSAKVAFHEGPRYGGRLAGLARVPGRPCLDPTDDGPDRRLLPPGAARRPDRGAPAPAMHPPPARTEAGPPTHH